MTKKRLLAIACPLYLLFFMGDAFLCSYYAHYFIESGMDPHQQSILLGVIPFALFVGCFVLSLLAKSRRRALVLYQACLFIEAALAVSFPFCGDFWSLLVVTSLIGFFNAAPFAFIEGYLVPSCGRLGIKYSYIRVFGTIGYFVSLFVGFFLLSVMPVRQIYFFACGLFLAAFGLSFLFLTVKEEEVEEENREKGKIKDILKVGVILLLVSELLSYGAFSSAAYIVPVYLKQLGLSDAQYSLIRSIGVGVEMVILLCIPLLGRKIKSYKVLLIISSSICFLSTLFGVFITEPYVLAYSNLIVAHIGKGIRFAFLALLFEKMVGKRSLAMALTINTGFIDLAAAALNISSSSIYLNLGFTAYFIIAASLQGVGLLILCQIPHKTIEAIS